MMATWLAAWRRSVGVAAQPLLGSGEWMAGEEGAHDGGHAAGVGHLEEV